MTLIRWAGIKGLLLMLVAMAGCSMVGPGHRLNWQSPYKDFASFEEGDIVHLPTGVEVSKEELIEIVSAARVVYVGETHDNIHAHKVQLEILTALWERYPGQIAVGMEMLKQSSQEVADQWSLGDLEEKAFVKTWQEDWTNDFQYYEDILRYLREKKIPLLALRPPDDWLGQVKKDPTMAQADQEADRLPDMDREDPYHRAHTEAVFGTHPKGAQDFEDFYKVQVLWDESMAARIVDYLLTEQGRDKRVVVFAGGQHVEYGFGIPRRAFRRLPLPYAIVLPTAVLIAPEKQVKLMDVAMPEIPLLPADFAWVVRYEGLEDERVYLGVMVREDEDGVRIVSTIKSSVAQEAGLEKGDIITAFDGEPIETSFDLTYLMGRKRAGDKGAVEVLRGEEVLHFDVTFKESHMHR
ncbi:MAG: ChaN family lipoprotein [Thermodesulfobacteriota bacterium]|nr:ChaN family lipoprotein [Thermodesulfobacteriota bacterium]